MIQLSNITLKVKNMGGHFWVAYQFIYILIIHQILMNLSCGSQCSTFMNLRWTKGEGFKLNC